MSYIACMSKMPPQIKIKAEIKSNLKNKIYNQQNSLNRNDLQNNEDSVFQIGINQTNSIE